MMNKKKKVMLVFGTRPEAIKMCPVIRELKKRKNIETKVCVTGQHREMLQQVLDIFEIVPDYDLEIMKEKQTLSGITQLILRKIDNILVTEQPDLVLVHGDTTSTFATALSCFYLRIPIGHVEAGLRTYNILSPYPEEFNRRCVGMIADFHFAPTEQAKRNLLKEGKKAEKIFVTGNTAIDALQYTIQNNYKHKEMEWVGTSKLILVTAHRRENVGEAMHHMFKAIKRIVEVFPQVKVIYPLHMNPVVRKIAMDILGKTERIHLIEPLNVVDFHNFMNASEIILTDSGGIQEEAPALGKPVLVMRDTTERPEGIEAGTLRLIGTEENNIFLAVKELLTNEKIYKEMAQAKNPYGDGTASKQIADIIEE